MPETTVIHVRDMQPGDIYIGRPIPSKGLTGSIWANRWKIGSGFTRADVLQLYTIDLRMMLCHPDVYDIETLRGKRLACWCHPKPCHGDVLVKVLAGKSL